MRALNKLNRTERKLVERTRFSFDMQFTCLQNSDPASAQANRIVACRGYMLRVLLLLIKLNFYLLPIHSLFTYLSE